MKITCKKNNIFICARISEVTTINVMEPAQATFGDPMYILQILMFIQLPSIWASFQEHSKKFYLLAAVPIMEPQGMEWVHFLMELIQDLIILSRRLAPPLIISLRQILMQNFMI